MRLRYDKGWLYHNCKSQIELFIGQTSAQKKQALEAQQ